ATTPPRRRRARRSRAVLCLTWSCQPVQPVCRTLSLARTVRPVRGTSLNRSESAGDASWLGGAAGRTKGGAYATSLAKTHAATISIKSGTHQQKFRSKVVSDARRENGCGEAAARERHPALARAARQWACLLLNRDRRHDV